MKQFYKKYNYWLKLIFSAILLSLIFLKVDYNTLTKSLKLITWWYYLLTIALFALMQFINGYRWHIFLDNYNLSSLIRYSFISQYYTFILPSSLTADISKIIIMEKKNNADDIVASVICDKIVTFFSMTITLMGAFVFCSSQGLKKLFLPATIFFFILVFVILFIYLIDIKKILNYLFKKSALKVFRNKTSDLLIVYFEKIQSKMMNFSAVYKSLISGILVQFVNTITLFIIDSIFNIGLNVFDYIIISSSLQILLMLPFSIGGIGFRDVSTVMVLGLAGVASNKALTYSLSLYPALVAVVIMGFFIQLKNNTIK